MGGVEDILLWLIHAVVKEQCSFPLHVSTHTHFLPQPTAPVADCWPVTVKWGCVHMDSYCFCMCVYASDACPFLYVLVTFAALYHMSPKPQALTSPSFKGAQFTSQKRAQGQSSIIQHTTTNLCLANNCFSKLRPCNKRVHSNPMSSHLMDLNRFHVSQIDQSQSVFAEMKTCFIPTWNKL